MRADQAVVRLPLPYWHLHDRRTGAVASKAESILIAVRDGRDGIGRAPRLTDKKLVDCGGIAVNPTIRAEENKMNDLTRGCRKVWSRSVAICLPSARVVQAAVDDSPHRSASSRR